MKRSLLFLSTLFVLVLGSCSGDEEEAAGVLTVNGTSYDLDYGMIYDHGTDTELTYRTYEIAFKTSDTPTPSNYITFYIRSTSTSRLQEGTYTYEYYSGKGAFSYPKIGFDVKYDSKNEAVEGTILSYSRCDFEGTIEVSKKDGDYLFEIEIEATKGDEKYTVTSDFNDALQDDGYFNF